MKNRKISRNSPCELRYASCINYQGLKFKCFLSIQLGYQDSKFSITPENPVSHFWILVTMSIIPCPIQTSFHNFHCYKLQL
jgi:hypothetical protein